MADANPNANVVNVIGGLLGQVLNQPGVRESLVQEAIKAIGGLLGRLFNRSPKPTPPPAPVKAPTPASVQPDPNFPDDHIPRPNSDAAPRKVARVKIKLERVQYSRERFPKLYTEDNPFGLADPGPIANGSTAMNWGSKFWVDLTAFDAEGKEFLRPDVLAYNLAFNTEIRVGDTSIKGLGAASPGGSDPKAGYETKDTAAVGQGITAWLSSLGFMQQFQAFGAADGKSFQVSGSVDGVEAENPFTVRVS
jgi:hypothetical protein